MKAKPVYILFLLLSLNLHFLFSQQKDQTIFKDVILDQPLPQIFRTGEIYYIKGKVLTDERNIRITADISLIDGEYSRNYSTICHENRFCIPIELAEKGEYYFNLSVNYDLKGTAILSVIDPIIQSEKPILPLTDFHFSYDDFSTFLNWQTANEIIHLQIVQDSYQKNYILTNNPDKFKFELKEFSEFKQDSITVRIRGARSIDGTWNTQCSEWGDWQTITAPAIEFYQKKVSLLARFNQPYKFVGTTNKPLKLDLKIKSVFDPYAYIIRPDGWVDKIPLSSANPIKKYSIGSIVTELLPKGNCQLNYLPEQEGVYIIEINDEVGNALINIPFYSGNYLPILPERKLADSLDIDGAVTYMLDQINLIRTKLNLPSLKLDSTLNAIGHYYANKMATEKFCGHLAPDQEDVIQRKIKFNIVTPLLENVAMAKTIELAFYHLCCSPAHYLSMIDSSVTIAGFGVAVDPANNFYIAQYFSTEPLTNAQINQFYSDLIDKINARRAKVKSIHKKKKIVKRLYQHPGWPWLNKIEITAANLKRLEEMIIEENPNITWKRESVRGILFEDFRQTVEGIKVIVKFYPYIPPKKVNNN